MANGDDDYIGAAFRGGPFPVPPEGPTERDFRHIEEAPARKEADLMREQGERAAGLRRGRPFSETRTLHRSRRR